MKRLLARPEVALFGLVFVAYAYFYQAGGWNQNSRFDLVRAIVEEHSLSIDPYVCMNPHPTGVPHHLNTGDVSCRGPEGRCQVAEKPGERTYCDKAPGVSFLAVPAYALLRASAGEAATTGDFLNRSAHVVTIWTLSLPSALAVSMLFLALGSLGVTVGVRVATSLAYGLGTLAFPYATLMYGNSLAAAVLVIAFSILIRARMGDTGTEPWRLVLVGALLGFSVVAEYSAALGALPLAFYTVGLVRPPARLGWVVLGALVPGLLLASYNWAAFGAPLSLSYDYSVFTYRQQALFGLGLPSWDALLGISVTPFRGLFYSAPWLVLAIPGCVWWATRRGDPRVRAEMAVCASVMLLFFWLNSSLEDWDGGWGIAPRFLLPAIPFMAIATVGVTSIWLESRRTWVRISGWIGFVLLVGFSGGMMLITTAVKPEVPDEIMEPFGEFLIPGFMNGFLSVNSQSIDAGEPLPGARHAYNLGHVLGLEGIISLVPLFALLAGASGWLWWSLRPRGTS